MKVKALLCVLSVMFFSVCSRADNSLCLSVKPTIDVLYQELLFEKGGACIYTLKEDLEKVEVAFFFDVEGRRKEVINRDFLNVSDMESVVPSLEFISEGLFQIVQSFPRDSLVILLGYAGGSIKLVGVQQTIKLESAEFDTPHVLTISMRQPELDSLSFERLNQDQVYNSGAFELSQSSVASYVVVTSERANLLENYKGGRKSGKYLVKGDKIRVLKFSENYFFVDYTSKGGVSIKGWIPVSDTL